jgi:hypothetical protein
MYLDFCIQVPLNTYLFQIKTKIADRHGRITDIVMYRDSVDDDNKLDDEMLTFEDMGFEGKPVTEGPVVSAANANALASFSCRPPPSLRMHRVRLTTMCRAGVIRSSLPLNSLPLSASLRLFRSVCRSVRFAVSGLCVFRTPYLSVSAVSAVSVLFPFLDTSPRLRASPAPPVTFFYHRNTACGTISSHSICR